MEAKDAVVRAKAYVLELFAEDGVSDVRLEEVERDEGQRVWNVTLGFLRSDPPRASGGLLATLDAISARRRAYRVVRVRESDGAVLSVKHRDLSADAA